MKQLLQIAFLVLSAAGSVPAQEYNFGVHLNPTLTVPLFDGNSNYNNVMRYESVLLNYNVGANINYKHKNFSLETGVNIVQKSVKFKNQSLGLPNGDMAYSYLRFTGTSFEFPLQGAVKLFHNKGKTIYDFYLQGGTSYEIYDNNVVAGGGGSSGETDVDIYQSAISSPKTFQQKQWMNAIFGFKINAIIKRFGLIDYGISYHLPFGYTGPYRMEAVVTGVNGSQTYTGDYSPKLSYIDFKFCYYFLNIGKDGQRIRYRAMN